MDPIETWHDAPMFEAMEKRINEKYATLVRAVRERLIFEKEAVYPITCTCGKCMSNRKLKAALAEIE
jgi:hypothetical protein